MTASSQQVATTSPPTIPYRKCILIMITTYLVLCILIARCSSTAFGAVSAMKVLTFIYCIFLNYLLVCALFDKRLDRTGHTISFVALVVGVLLLLWGFRSRWEGTFLGFHHLLRPDSDFLALCEDLESSATDNHNNLFGPDFLQVRGLGVLLMP